MLYFLPAKLRGALSMVLLVVSTICLCLPLYVLAGVRFVVPAAAKPWFTRRIMDVAELWITDNNLIIDLFQRLDIQVQGLGEVSRDRWYLVISNHQSWADILILQRLFNRRIPLLKFFIKQELLWVPFIGIAWWALDFPIMRRPSREQLSKHPELRGKDLDATRRACEQFELTPVSVLNFVEGTRFTEEKRARQNSPFHHLLRPKSGGPATVIGALGTKVAKIIDVTIIYPDGTPGFFDFMAGRTRRIIVDIDMFSPPDDLTTGDYETDQNYRKRFQTWMRERWDLKDARIAERLGPA